MNETVKKFIKAHAEESQPHECGGIIVKNSFGLIAERCKNISPTPEKHCLLSRDEIISKSKGSELVYFYHSHPSGKQDSFSWEDKYVSEKLKLKLILYCLENETFKVYEPRGWVAPFVGRNYCLGIFADSELVEDYYQKYFNVYLEELEDANVLDASGQTLTKKEISDLSEFFPTGLKFKYTNLKILYKKAIPKGHYNPHQKKGTWECVKLREGLNKKTMQNYYVDLLTKSKFKLVKNLEKHNLLILGGEGQDQWDINYPAHFGIYLGNDSILHHPYQEKSRIDKLDSLGYNTDAPLRSFVRKILKPLFNE
jgi:proteasome lid subunit RPN8/RPN11